MTRGLDPTGWFDKASYTGKSVKDRRLDRYGTDELRKISDWLATQSIKPSKIVTNAKEVNNFLGTPRAREHIKNLETLELAIHPRTFV